MRGITDAQRRVLDFVRATIDRKGYPPTVREICIHFGFRSTNAANDHLEALKRKGFITRDDAKIRAIQVVARPLDGAAVVRASERREPLVQVPVLARIRAGRPLVDEDEIVTHLALSAEGIPGTGQLFGLRVTGTTLRGEGILPGDTVVFRAYPEETVEGALCAVMVGDEAIIRRVTYRGGYVVLLTGTPEAPPILVRVADFSKTHVVGKAVRMWRAILPAGATLS